MRVNLRNRKGGVTLEMLLLMPVLLAVVVASVEFSLLIAAEQRLEKASALAGRVAAQGGQSEAVEKAVRAALGGGRWKNAKIQATLEDKERQPLPSGAYVEVTITIPATDVVPDLLSFIGISLRNETLQSRSLLRKE